MRDKDVAVASLTSETSPTDKKEVRGRQAVRCCLRIYQIVRDLASGHPVNRLLYSKVAGISGRVVSLTLVTPEKLCTPEFIQILSKLYEQKELNRLVVDEVSNLFPQDRR